MPSFIYRFSNLAIMVFFIILITTVMNYLPKLLQLLPFMDPSDESTKLGQSLFSPIASSVMGSQSVLRPK